MSNQPVHIIKEPYWNELVCYFYDNVHWSGKGVASIHQWLKRDYGCESSYSSNYLKFNDSKDATGFILKWS